MVRLAKCMTRTSGYISFSLSLSLSPRGHIFRKEFSNLGEIGSICPLNVHLLALTDTVTFSTRHYITSNLSMKQENTHIVQVPPVADKPAGSIPEEFGPIEKKLRTTAISVEP